jgi:SAM-dependent methyltransferase
VRLYDDLAPWYRLLDPPDDHADEAAAFARALEDVVGNGPASLLELGAGAGHNAVHLKRRFRCTLSDPSEGMTALSRALNPECAHVPGDMRTLRLGLTYDAVLVHDAVMYMTSAADLRLAAETAFVHTRPGGAAVFAPDCTRETFVEATELIEGDDGARALRCLEWSWDPDPADDTFRTEYVLLLRNGSDVAALHDGHVEGLFTRAVWEETLTAVGYRVDTFARPIGDGVSDEVFLARRP